MEDEEALVNCLDFGRSSTSTNVLEKKIILPSIEYKDVPVQHKTFCDAKIKE